MATLTVRGCYGSTPGPGGYNAAFLVERHGDRWVLRGSQHPDRLDFTDLVAELRLQPLPGIPNPPQPAPPATPPSYTGTGLPRFRFHPDPGTSGALTLTPTTGACILCGHRCGWRYAGPLYTRHDEISEGIETGEVDLCPRCIADGHAADRWQAHFVEFAPTRRVDPAAADEIEHRMPGFWYDHSPGWPVHHHAPAAYLRTVTPTNYPQLSAKEQDAVRAGGPAYLWDDQERLRWDPTGGSDLPGVPLFRCLTCQTLILHAG